MNTIIIHPLAQAEFERKLSWLRRNGYLVNSSQLFYEEIGQLLHDLEKRTRHREIAQAPGYFRGGPTRMFRYSAIYKLEGDLIHLVAFAAPERRPGYWKRRTG